MNRSDDASVAVVGAGVAGCGTALHLARRGHDVLVLERGGYPREKVCGEGLMPHGVEELDGLGLLETIRSQGARPFRGIAYQVGEARALGRFPPHPTHRDGLGVRRLALDHALARACAEHPRIELRTGVRVTGVAVRPDDVALETSEGPVSARLLVGADGRGSRVRRALGLHVRPTARPRFGVRAHYRLAPGRDEPDMVQVIVAEDVEFYVTPTGQGEVNIALLCGRDVTRRFAGDLPGGFSAEIARCGTVAALLYGAEPLTEPTLCGPLRQDVRGVVADRALLVGDAAGFVDAITGEGMSLALVSGRLAAETAHQALRSGIASRHALASYTRAHAGAVRDPARLTEILLRGLRHRWLARRVVRRLDRDPDLFAAILAVNSGRAPLTSIGLGGLLRLIR